MDLDQFIYVKRDVKRVSNIDDASEWRGLIDIGGCTGISINLSAGQITIDERQDAKVTVDGSGNIYPVTLNENLNYPYLYSPGTSLLIKRLVGYVGAVSFTITLIKPNIAKP